VSPYRAAARATDAPRFVAKRPLPTFVLGALLVGLAGMIATTLLTANARLLPYASLFALPAVAIVLLRTKTTLYDDRIVQGRLAAKTLKLEDATHVIHMHAGIDPFLSATAVSAAGLDLVTIATRNGTTVAIAASEIPKPILDDVVRTALASAVDAAERAIASGTGYRGLDDLSGLDVAAIHGFAVGLVLRRVSMPLEDIVAIASTGLVTSKSGSTFRIARADLVLEELLRRRGLVA
jgi:hypothetical protein